MKRSKGCMKAHGGGLSNKMQITQSTKKLHYPRLSLMEDMIEGSPAFSDSVTCSSSA